MITNFPKLNLISKYLTIISLIDLYSLNGQNNWLLIFENLSMVKVRVHTISCVCIVYGSIY